MCSSNLPDCVAANNGDFTSVLKHALGHVLGWTNVVHKQGVPRISDNSVMYLSEEPHDAIRAFGCFRSR